MKRQGLLLVVSGPSGVGKGTIIRELMARHEDLVKSVSCTTRSPRPGERDGEDYRFVSATEFARMRDDGEFLEWATVHGDLLYGTPKAPVEQALAQGQDIVLEIDYQGATSVRAELGGHAVLVFVAPPSWAALRSRLAGRATESEADVQERLTTASREMANMWVFEYVVVNATIPQAVVDLEAILLGERQRLKRNDWRSLRDEILGSAGAG